MVSRTRNRNYTKQRTARQIVKDRDAKRLSERWPIRPANRSTRSRGMANSRIKCYVIAALQTILHAPKVMSWINTHNVPSRNNTTLNPCWSRKTGQPLEGDKDENGDWDFSDDPDNWYPHCIACIMAGLIAEYWGDTETVNGQQISNLDARRRPRTIRNRGNFRRICQFAEYLYVEEEPDPFNPGEFVSDERQQCPAEFQEALTKACQLSTDPSALFTDPYYHSTWNSLFWVDMLISRTPCTSCGAMPTQPSYINPSFGLSINAEGVNTVEEGIENIPNNLWADFRCGCRLISTTGERSRIVSAPEVLRLSLSIFQRRNGQPHKMIDPIKIPWKLNLTHGQVFDPADASLQQSAPLFYKLSSVISHGGEGLDAGHYATTVKGPARVYTINDQYVQRRNHTLYDANPHLRKNPHVGVGITFHGWHLFYIRDRSVERSMQAELAMQESVFSV